MRLVVFLLVLTLTLRAHAQFDMEDSHTTANLRGVSNTGGGAVWASGSSGTVLRSEDGGYLWQTCNMPPGAKDLDFRGIQAFDEKAAIVMSSGVGDLSRLYKTTDGCQTWKLVFTNPDKQGFWDSLRRVTGKQMYLLGDPVDHKFAMFLSQDSGSTWFIADDPGLEASGEDSAFAASNSVLTATGPFLIFGTGGDGTAHIYRTVMKCEPSASSGACSVAWAKTDTPLAAGTPSSGIFSLANRMTTSQAGKSKVIVVAVGGSYDKPEAHTSTAAFSTDGGEHWSPSLTQPHGYRSAVAFDSSSQTWITVGPNGTDISTDDGKNWRPLKPSPTDPPDADKSWNALSLPFVVGPNGRIGRLRTMDPKAALTQPGKP